MIVHTGLNVSNRGEADIVSLFYISEMFQMMISKSELIIRFGLAKVKSRQAEAHILNPVYMVIELHVTNST